MRWKGKEQRSKTIPALCRIPDTHGGLAALIATLHGQPVLSRTPQARQSRLSLTGLIGCATYVFQKANYGWLALLCPFRLGKFFQSSSILGLTFYLQAFLTGGEGRGVPLPKTAFMRLRPYGKIEMASARGSPVHAPCPAYCRPSLRRSDNRSYRSPSSRRVRPAILSLH